jgi:hypothetical protein
MGLKLTAAVETEGCDADGDAGCGTAVSAGDTTLATMGGANEADGLVVCCSPAETVEWPCGRSATALVAAIATTTTAAALLAALRLFRRRLAPA